MIIVERQAGPRKKSGSRGRGGRRGRRGAVHCNCIAHSSSPWLSCGTAIR